MTTTRRAFLNRTAALALACRFPGVAHAAPSFDAVRAAVEQAHAEMWRRFVDEHNVVLDYTDLDGGYDRATPEECRLGKPNAMAWWTPIENGAMFNGLYMDAVVSRALQTKAAADQTKARRLAEGLLLLASVGDVPGFVARGVATDGKTTYPMGSNDQTAPWFYGLWRYAQSGLADDALRRRIVAKMSDVADVLERTGWRMPAAEPFRFRGGFAEVGWDGSPRLLFLMKAMHELTGDAKWSRHYEQTLHARGGEGTSLTHLEACSLGVESRPKQKMWTGSVSNACLRELWEMEGDEAVRGQFERGLVASARFAAGVLPLCREFDSLSGKHFEGDWRKMNAMWREQKTVSEANDLAHAQLAWKNNASPRRRDEVTLVREPAFAAWIVTLCPDRAVVAKYRDEVLATLGHYRYDQLRYSQFFPVESAWWRLQQAS